MPAPLVRWRWDRLPPATEWDARIQAIRERNLGGLVLEASLPLLIEAGARAPALPADLELWLAPTDLQFVPPPSRLRCDHWITEPGRWRKRRFAHEVVHALLFPPREGSLELAEARDITAAVQTFTQPPGLRRDLRYRVMVFVAEPAHDASSSLESWTAALEALREEWSAAQLAGFWLSLPRLRWEADTVPHDPSFDLHELPALFIDVGPRTTQIRQQFWTRQRARLQTEVLEPLQQWLAHHGLRGVAQPVPESLTALALDPWPGEVACSWSEAQELSCKVLAARQWPQNCFALLPPFASRPARERAALIARCLLAGATRVVLDAAGDLDLIGIEADDLRERVRVISKLIRAGDPGARVAVLFPHSSLLAHGAPGEPLGQTVEDDFAYLLARLAELKHNWALVDESQLAQARVTGGNLQIGERAFELLVLPSVTTLPRSLWDQLVAFSRAGGRVAAYGLLPRHSELGADADLARSVTRVARVDLPSLYDTFMQTAGNEGVFLDSFPVFNEIPGGGRFCTFQPRLSPDQTDATLRMRQILRESITPDLETAGDLLVGARRTHEGGGDTFVLVNTGAECARATLQLRSQGHPVRHPALAGPEAALLVYAVLNDEVIAVPLELAPFELLAWQLTPQRAPHVETANFTVESFERQADAFVVRGLAPGAGQYLAELVQQLPAPDIAEHADEELQLLGSGPRQCARRWSGSTRVEATAHWISLTNWQPLDRPVPARRRRGPQPSAPQVAEWLTTVAVDELGTRRAFLSFEPQHDWLELELDGVAIGRAVLAPWRFEVTHLVAGGGSHRILMRIPGPSSPPPGMLALLPVVELRIPLG